MDIEFHYYVNFLVALAAGYNKDNAYKIAHSSQMTDDNNNVITVRMKNGFYYKNKISHSFSPFLSTNVRNIIYECFHFVPGNNYFYPKLTRANSNNIQELLLISLASDNPYLIGVASHAYADTWAHQNFCGRNDNINASSGLIESLIPNIGHADAFDKPDLTGLIWVDKRFKLKIDNSKRFIRAAIFLYNYYSSHLKKRSLAPKMSAHDLELLLSYCYGKSSSRYSLAAANKYNRIKKYNKVCFAEFGINIPHYHVIENESDIFKYSSFIKWKYFQESVKFFAKLVSYKLELDK